MILLHFESFPGKVQQTQDWKLCLGFSKCNNWKVGIWEVGWARPGLVTRDHLLRRGAAGSCLTCYMIITNQRPVSRSRDHSRPISGELPDMLQCGGGGGGGYLRFLEPVEHYYCLESVPETWLRAEHNNNMLDSPPPPPPRQPEHCPTRLASQDFDRSYLDV